LPFEEAFGKKKEEKCRTIQNCDSPQKEKKKKAKKKKKKKMHSFL